ncbi:pyridoxal phosphate-dependent decarboxylase family protein [Gaoshiqia sp. Z1-71]|uniref:pyridoxal phosphate-dependent decarboxylase family protein n=1 Tax=Gaoshiqia hydrogeniformans TaxID=3290090 RepID=UPI003BF77543
MKTLTGKNTTLNMGADEFRSAAHELTERIATFMEELPEMNVTKGENPIAIRSFLTNKSLPLQGEESREILKEASELLFGHSLFNGHPRFWGYITSSAAPIGALADFLASSVNANVGAFALSPMATEIEQQTIAWLSELIGYQANSGGIFVSGGNMANFLGFLAARRNKIGEKIREEGLAGLPLKPVIQPWGAYSQVPFPKPGKKHFTVYCAKGTHTWIQKAVDLFGHGTDSIRWIDLTDSQQMSVTHLQEQIRIDIRQGHQPFLVVGNAGSVSTGTVDPLREIANFCKTRDLWFHIDGAYGAPAAVVPELANLFDGLAEADSIALDPHKWLYSPLEAGCILVRDRKYLHDAFSFNPEYYNFGGNGYDQPVNFHEYGMQNSRGFRALKVWMSIKQMGKNGLTDMIRNNINLSEKLFHLVQETPDLQAISQNLSITTFRYVPSDIEDEVYLNKLNQELLNKLQSGGEVFLSNAIVNGHYCLRPCIVNFRTSYADLEALVSIVLREGKKIHESLLVTIE